jgi:hypothetical protein
MRKTGLAGHSDRSEGDFAMVEGAEARTTAGMRVLLRVAAVLVFLIGIPLLLASASTDTYFAWTIATPLTAAFLGASYWSAAVLEWMASGRDRWSHARVAVPAVFIFTVITLIVTIVHIDRFHFSAPAAVTRTVTWVWLCVYAIVPLLMIAAWVAQRGAAGQDGPRRRPLPSLLRAMLAVQGIVLGLSGLALLLATDAVKDHWPWDLTPLTARAIGAWLFALGIAVLHSTVENDFDRVRPAAASYLVLAVLQLIVLWRFGVDFEWGTVAGLVYAVFLGWIALVAAWMLFPATR